MTAGRGNRAPPLYIPFAEGAPNLMPEFPWEQDQSPSPAPSLVEVQWRIFIVMIFVLREIKFRNVLIGDTGPFSFNLLNKSENGVPFSPF